MNHPNHRNAVSQYSQVDTYSAVAGADPHRLVLMLMDGVLTKLAVAKGGLERKDMAVKGAAIGQAISIIGGLQGSLDLEAGGELAANLDALYTYMEQRLTQANIHNDLEALEEVARLMNEIRAGWMAIPDEYRQVSAAPAKVAAGG